MLQICSLCPPPSLPTQPPPIRLYDYLWVAEDGMKMQGYNGSQLWDTAFAVQAVASTGLAGEAGACLQAAARFIDANQVAQEAQQPLEEYYRHISRGAWPFSTGDHGWPISDCRWDGKRVGGLRLGG